MMHKFSNQSTDPLKEANLTISLPAQFWLSAVVQKAFQNQSDFAAIPLHFLCIPAIPNNLQLMWESP